MDRDARLKRLKFRAWHRGTKEADLMVGGFYDRYAQSWSDDEISWFEHFIDEQDVDIMAWTLGTANVPEDLKGLMMDAFLKLDFIEIGK